MYLWHSCPEFRTEKERSKTKGVKIDLYHTKGGDWRLLVGTLTIPISFCPYCGGSLDREPAQAEDGSSPEEKNEQARCGYLPDPA